MRRRMALLLCVATISLCGFRSGQALDPLQVRDLFNNKGLSGGINVNTAQNTWSIPNDTQLCTGLSIRILRIERQHENFILGLEWKHLQAADNSRNIRIIELPPGRTTPEQTAPIVERKETRG